MRPMSRNGNQKEAREKVPTAEQLAELQKRLTERAKERLDLHGGRSIEEIVKESTAASR
jgi:hypothetical protein